MPKGILGRKLGMTQVFEENGRLTPVTVVEAGPCKVVQRKTVEKDGYEAVQLAFGAIRPKRVNMPLKGHFAKAGVEPARYLRELRVEDSGDFQALNVGDEVKADIFSPGEYVDVTGVTKGKGFQGVIKRWNMRRGAMSHGSRYHRGVGALNSVGPARVFKGRKLPGRMGGVRRTVQGLRVVRVDADRNLMLIAGSVPGPKGSLLLIRQTVKNKA